jgi:hypothetical protein
MTGDASEEAAWRELVAHYATPAVADGTPTPWPTREDLPGPGAAQDGADPDGAPSGGDAGPGGGPADPSGPDTADLDVTGLDMSDLEVTDFEAASPDADGGEPSSGPRRPPGAWSAGGVIPGPPHIRIVRPASTPSPDDDDHFVPPAPPPLPRLDPVTKGAWLGLFGGPAYLLVAVMLHWQVPGLAAFAAVAAFVGGFATLVVRMGDRPPRDSGPDDGAVV